MLPNQLYIYYLHEYLVYHNCLTRVIRSLLFSTFWHNICVAVLLTENPTISV